jgi:hypothetical protein
VAADFNLRISPNGTIAAAALAAASGPFANAPVLDLGNSSSMGGSAPTVTIASAQTASESFTEMTVTGWFNTDEPPVNGVTVFRHAANNKGWQVTFTGPQRMNLAVNEGPSAGTNYQSNTAAFAADTGKWQFFAVTWTAAGGAQWYVGSEQSAPVTDAKTATPRNMGSGSGIALTVGRQNSGGSAFKGKFADLRIYDTALDAAQIAEIHAAVKPPQPVITGFTPEAIEAGGKVVITGSNFTGAGGAGAVTDVLFDTVAAGAANFTVDSDTRITVNPVPAGIPATGDVKLLFASGSAVGPTPYAVLSAPLVQYDFQGSETQALNSGALGAALDTGNYRTTDPKPVPGAEGSGPNGLGRSLDLTANTSNGTHGSPSTAATTELQTRSALTFTGWFKTAAGTQPIAGVALLSNNNSTNGGWIIQFNTPPDAAHQQLQLTVYGLGASPASTYCRTDAPAFAYDDAGETWQFFAVTWDSATGMSWWRGSDSPAEPLTTAGSNAVAQTMTASSSSLILGTRTGSAGGFKGHLADLRIYEGALAEPQIAVIRRQAIVPPPPPPDPLVHYTFDDDAPADADTKPVALTNTGALGTVFDLTAIGADTRITAAGDGAFGAGRALSLDGNAAMNQSSATAYTAITGNKAGLDGLAEMTVTGWMKPTAALGTGGATLFRYSDGSGGVLNGWNMSVASRDRLGLNVGDTGTEPGQTTPKATYTTADNTFANSTDAWRFFAITWSATGGAQWYAGAEDTAPAVVVTATGYDGLTTMATGARAFRVGYAGSGNGFKGLLDDLRIYGATLTAAQVKTVYDESKPPTPPPPPAAITVAGFTPTDILTGGTVTITGSTF